MSETNAHHYAALLGNTDVMRQITGRPLTHAEAVARMRKTMAQNAGREELGGFLVWRIADGAFMGMGKLACDAFPTAELGYALMPEFWGQGYGGEIAERLVALARGVAGLSSLYAITDPENKGSVRVLEKCGFALDRIEPLDGLSAAYFSLQF